jgi:hypothetical protein
MAAIPLNLFILRTVEKFGRLPLTFLYSQVPASQDEIEKQVQILATQGALKLDGGDVMKVEDSSVSN